MTSYRLIDQSDDLDYTEDFSDWLDSGVTIDSAVWTIYPTGPTLHDQMDTDTASTIFVSGCTRGVVYKLSCEITTTAQTLQVSERSIELRCDHR